jgi:Fe-S cluster biogenesis protein NfuA
MTQPQDASQIRITGEPAQDPNYCRFIVERRVQRGAALHARAPDEGRGNALAEALFKIEGVREVEIRGFEVWIGKAGTQEWPAIGKQIGTAIREFLANAPAEDLGPSQMDSPEAREVQRVLDEQINPAVASHGGYVTLRDFRDDTVYIEFEGGCQGCGMANVTLKQGIEGSIKKAVPKVRAVLDMTDHESGTNPYFQPSK